MMFENSDGLTLHLCCLSLVKSGDLQVGPSFAVHVFTRGGAMCHLVSKLLPSS